VRWSPIGRDRRGDALRPGLTLAGNRPERWSVADVLHHERKAWLLSINSPAARRCNSLQSFAHSSTRRGEALSGAAFRRGRRGVRGYMIACAGDEIFSIASSILGSSSCRLLLVSQELIKKIGWRAAGFIRRASTTGDARSFFP